MLKPPNLHIGETRRYGNTGSPQPTADVKSGGTGTANILNTATQFNLNGNRVLINPGTANLFAGVGAVNSGQRNSFFGDSAGLANTTGGGGNAFFGTDAGQSNKTGSDNTINYQLVGFCVSSNFTDSYKMNIRPFSGGLDVVKRLNPVSFRWKENGVSAIGLNADEVAAVAPQIVSRSAAGKAGEVQDIKKNTLIWF